MATLVFRASAGDTLQQVQVGAADIVATLNAASSAWGWIGGLAGIRRLLSSLKTTIHKDPFETLHLSRTLHLPTARCHILTCKGMLYFEDEDETEAFGGDPVTQSIGLTICALAHECGGEIAVDFFIKFILEHYMEGQNKIPGLSETLYHLLMDNISVILNEGATRGLHTRFEEAAEGLPEAAKFWQYNSAQSDSDTNRLQNFELSLVGGLLDWLTGLAVKGNDPYFTRSSLAARTAAYLKAVGYDMGPIVVWDGQGPPPQPRPRGVVLVLAGVSDTDFYQGSDIRIPDSIATGIAHVHMYFRTDTAGSMLLNALGTPTSIRVETVQTLFEAVQTCIKSSLECEWEASDSQRQCLLAMFKKRARLNPKPLGVRLASMYFALSADVLSTCYEMIATESVLECVQRNKFKLLDHVNPGDFGDLARFRIITASIVITFVSMLSKDFDSTLHVTQLYLGSSFWLDEVCGYLDKHSASGIAFHDAAILVATIHSAAPSNLLHIGETERYSILGFRAGPSAVLPALLVEMAPVPESIGIYCLDKFIGNVPVFKDGSIRGTAISLRNWAPPGDGRFKYTSWQTLQEPRLKPSDSSLYLGIERPILHRDPFVALGARIGGSVSGYSCIKTAMWAISRSLKSMKPCPGHNKRQLAVKLDASLWAIFGQDWTERLDGPLTKTHDIFLPALGSAAWALHLAGQQYTTLISYDCFDCAMADRPPRENGPFLVVGYGPPQRTPASQFQIQDP